MTTVLAGRRALAGASATGCLALLARPWAPRVHGDPAALLLLGFVTLLAIGVAWPLPAADGRPSAAATAALVLAIGVAAFIVGRVLAPGTASPFVARALALNALAAVAEEAFFRRLVFGALQPHGLAVAVVGSAAVFAVVHVTVWGTGVLALDFAAGLVLSWQRAVSGRWTVPAATHIVANLLAAV